MSTPSSPLGAHDLNDAAGAELDTTVAALEAGITSVTPSAALRVVEHWEATLRNADDANLHPLADLLAELRDALAADRLDGRHIGDLLLSLGEGTTAAAADAPEDRIGPRLEQLGALLTRGGRSLGAKPVEAPQPRVGDGS